MSVLCVRERQVRDITVLDLEGDITWGEGADTMRSSIKRLIEQGKCKILLNLAKVRYVDSDGLGKLIAVYTSLRNQGGQLKLLHVTKRLREILVITKLATVFDVFDDETAALDNYRWEYPYL